MQRFSQRSKTPIKMSRNQIKKFGELAFEPFFDMNGTLFENKSA